MFLVSLCAVPYPPIGKLELLVCLYTAAVLQQEGQRVAGQTEDSAGLACVKHVDNVEPKVPLEPENVIVSSVKNLQEYI